MIVSVWVAKLRFFFVASKQNCSVQIKVLYLILKLWYPNAVGLHTSVLQELLHDKAGRSMVYD